MDQPKKSKRLLLQPFSAENSHQGCKVTATLTKEGTLLNIVFDLSGQLNLFIIPCFNPSVAQRKDNLWEHTCFEIFLGNKNKPGYWEFNLSPSGDWNIYSFSDYREGMKPEASFDTLPLELHASDRELRLNTVIDLNLIPVSSDLKMGLSAILEYKEGTKSYWALRHFGDSPDFHARKSWLSI